MRLRDASRTSGLLGLGLLAAGAGPAHAEPAAAQLLPAVAVTAQKREQRAQDVPVSLTVLSGRQLESAGIDSAAQLDQVAPGLTVGLASPGYLSIGIRGIADLDGGLLGTPATGFYLDETPLSAFTAQLPQLSYWDAERVEVLRGPQGTLFGEGSMGGTVRLITTKPDASALAARVATGWSRVQGGGQGATAHAMLNLPLHDDTLALRATASRQDLVGWVDVPELQARDANAGRAEDARLALRWTPARRLTVDLSWARQDFDSGDPSATSPGVYRPSELDPGAQAPAFVSTRSSRYTLANLTVQHDLGPVAMVAAWSRYQRTASLRSDLTPFVPLYFGPEVHGSAERGIEALTVKARTAELRLASPGGQPLNWTVGAYAKEDTRVQHRAGLVISLPELGLPRDETLFTTPARLRARALFGEAEFVLSPAWALQAGLRRYASDNRTRVHFDTTSAIFPGFNAGVVRDSGSSARARSPMFGLSWRPQPELLVFAKRSTGFRDGDSNYQPPGHPEVPAGYGPEQVRAHELGVKARPLAWLALDASLYRNVWTDLQLPFVTRDGLFGYLRNAGRAAATGAELEAVARPVAGLRLGLGLAMVDTRIDDDAGGPAGRRVPFSPRRQAALSVAHESAWRDGLQATLSARLAYRSETAPEPSDDARLRNPAYRNLSLQAGVAGPVWSATVYVRNATDSRTSLKRSKGAAGAVVTTHFLEPRSAGVVLGARF